MSDDICPTCKGDGSLPATALGMRYTLPDQPCPDCDGTGAPPKKALAKPAADEK